MTDRVFDCTNHPLWLRQNRARDGTTRPPARGFIVAVLVAGKGSLPLRIRIVCGWVLVVVLAPWAGKKLGLPKQQAAEAYITSLRRWWRDRTARQVERAHDDPARG